ncbi:MAG: polysaccharide deacetylase family protein [Elusimicrobiales bacterium]|nr:polysaccharide deacetylase family protein [Elusimicrobiales bacterium]
MKKNLIMCVVLLSLAAGTCRAAGSPAGKFYAEGDRKKAEFALTYDDGPGYITEDLLKLLEKHGVKASFFMVGTYVRQYPDRVKKVAGAGHLVCNHTDTHMFWPKTGKAPDHEAILKRELERAEAAIEKASGVRTTVLRMPNGYDKPWVRQVAGRLGYAIVNWTYGSDWTRLSEEKMTAEYLKAVKPGAIILMHDGGGKVKEKNLRITEAILQEAKKKGLKPVRLDDLLGLRAAAAAK